MSYKIIKHIILWFWCFPQNLLGFLVKIVTRAERVGDHYRYENKSGSVSLGEYIFLAPYDWGDERVLAHEMGHRAQSRRLGWLYLPVIGLPSIIWRSCFGRYRVIHGVGYYEFYTEKWANKLGGVTDKNAEPH